MHLDRHYQHIFGKMDTSRHLTRVDVRGSDKHTIHSASLLVIGPKRVGGVQKALMHTRLEPERQACQDLQGVVLERGLQALRRNRVVSHKVRQVHLERGAVGLMKSQVRCTTVRLVRDNTLTQLASDAITHLLVP